MGNSTLLTNYGKEISNDPFNPQKMPSLKLLLQIDLIYFYGHFANFKDNFIRKLSKHTEGVLVAYRESCKGHPQAVFE